MYAKHMDKLYEKLVQSLRLGGTITVVIKDQMQAGQRIFHSTPCIKSITDYGCKLIGWEKWKTPGNAFASLQKSKGNLVVEDEDILTWRKLK